MQHVITLPIPSLPVDVGINGSPLLESTLEPVTVVVMVIVAVL